MLKTLFLVSSPDKMVPQLLFAGLSTTYSYETIEWIEETKVHGQGIEGFYTASHKDENSQVNQVERAMRDRCQAIIVSGLEPVVGSYRDLAEQYNYQVRAIVVSE